MGFFDGLAAARLQSKQASFFTLGQYKLALHYAKMGETRESEDQYVVLEWKVIESEPLSGSTDDGIPHQDVVKRAGDAPDEPLAVGDIGKTFFKLQRKRSGSLTDLGKLNITRLKQALAELLGGHDAGITDDDVGAHDAFSIIKGTERNVSELDPVASRALLKKLAFEDVSEGGLGLDDDEQTRKDIEDGLIDLVDMRGTHVTAKVIWNQKRSFKNCFLRACDQPDE